ncbi:MAG TPA: glycosyl hydrolase family 18 protein, partial [Pseudonocardiaceae bacterium]
STVIAPGTEKYAGDNAIKAWTVGDTKDGIAGGFPANKLTLGIPFYYRGWTGVPAGANHGLYQTASGPAAGATDSGNVPGIQMFKEIKSVVTNPADTFWDPASQSAYFYDGSTFWTGEDTQSIQARTDYVHCNGLAGTMMFSMYDLDDPTNTLFNTLVNDLAATTSSCTNPPPTTTGGTPTTTTNNPPPTTTTNNPPPTTTTGGGSGGSCSGVAAWNNQTAYPGGSVVTNGGHQWTANQWNFNEVPGGSSGAWTDNGSC